MDNKQSKESLKSKTAQALLELLRVGQTGESDIDPDYLGYIIDELNSRKLSEKETKMFENLMNLSFEDVPIKNVDLNSKFSEEENKTIQNNTRIEPGRYSALKMMVGLISILGYIVIITGIVLLVISLNNGQTTTGILSLIISVVIALSLIAFANLIHVLIDIEHNTRRTRDILEEKFK